MSRRFKIPKMPSTVNKTIRFPQSVVDQGKKRYRALIVTFPNL